MRFIFFFILGFNFLVRLRIALQNYDIPPLNSPICPDAFYYFSIARNIVTGYGITLDKTVITNGFQPLYQFVLLPVFYFVSNPFHAINMSLILAVVFYAGISIMLYKLIGLYFGDLPAILATAIWVCSPIVTKNMMNGMETSLSVFLCITTVYFYLKRIRPIDVSRIGYREAFTFGLLIGLLYLARFDNIILVGLIFLDYLRFNLPYFKKRIYPKILLTTIIALLVAGPWIYYCIHYFGSVMPQSGRASRLIAGYSTGLSQGQWLIANFQSSLITGLNKSDPILGTFSLVLEKVLHGPMPFVLSLLLVLIGLGIIAFFAIHTRKKSESSLAMISIAFMLVLMIVYPIFMPINWFYDRYFAFFGVIFAIAYAYIIDLLITKYRIRKFIVSGVIGVLCILMVSAHIHYVKKSPPFGVYRQVINWIAENTDPARHTIGIFQAEIVPYYISNNFINLDGKCNVNAMNAMENMRMWNYILDEGIDYIIDRHDVLETHLFRRSDNMAPASMILLEQIKANNQAWDIYKVNNSIARP